VPLEPTIVIRDSGLVAASWRDLNVFHWRGRSSIDQLKACNEFNARAAAAQTDKKVAILTVVSAPEITLPDAEMRRELEDGQVRLADSKKAETLVIETQGFVAAAVRGIVAGSMLLKKTRIPTRLAPSVHEACTWIAPLLMHSGGRPIPREQVHAAVDAILKTNAASATAHRS
jgi:hypothetical protein